MQKKVRLTPAKIFQQESRFQVLSLEKEIKFWNECNRFREHSAVFGKHKHRKPDLAKFELAPLSTFGILILFLFNWHFGQTRRSVFFVLHSQPLSLFGSFLKRARLVIFCDEYFMQLRRNQNEPDTALFKASSPGMDTLVRGNEMWLNHSERSGFTRSKQISKQERLGAHGSLEWDRGRFAAAACRAKVQVSI